MIVAWRALHTSRERAGAVGKRLLGFAFVVVVVVAVVALFALHVRNQRHRDEAAPPPPRPAPSAPPACALAPRAGRAPRPLPVRDEHGRLRAMSRLALVSLVFAFVAVASGCGDAKPPSPTAKVSAARTAEAVAALGGVADEICACKDVACMNAVSDKRSKMLSTYADVKGTEADSAKVADIDKRITECMGKIVADDPALGKVEPKSASDAITAYQKLANEMCACADATCATATKAKSMELSKQFTTLAGGDSDIDQINVIGQKMAGCLAKFPDAK